MAKSMNEWHMHIKFWFVANLIWELMQFDMHYQILLLLPLMLHMHIWWSIILHR
jgi:hypothetical protein